MEPQQLVDSCLKKQFVDYSTSRDELQDFYKQLTGHEYPFVMLPGEQCPRKEFTLTSGNLQSLISKELHSTIK
jgi:hypothetical protein